MSRQNASEPALLRDHNPHVDQVRQGIVGAAGALRALRRNPSPEGARRLATHLHGLHIAAVRLADVVSHDRPQ